MPQDEMQVTIDPPLSRWHYPSLQRTPRIATGHQLWHWHPGILAKYYAVDAFARDVGGETLNVWVNHDTVDATLIELPVIEGNRAASHTLQLGPCDASLPTCAQPAVDPAKASKALTDAADSLAFPPGVRVDRLADAWERAPSEGTLDEQMVAVLEVLLRGHVRFMPSLLSSRILQTPEAEPIVARMLHDAIHCVQCFNQAVAEHPEAGIRPLGVEPLRVELPLWALVGRQPRQRVFADLSDRKPMLTLESGEPVDAKTLAPRALLLTALLRAYFCDLFIHGTGGGVYDRVMERWWYAWTGERLAPIAVATANVRIPMEGVPLATRDDLAAAVWMSHHLPHNVDRYAIPGEIDTALAARKRELLVHMDDDRDRHRRRAAFRELQEINHTLAASQPRLIAEAARGIDLARIGVENQRVAEKRDWCFSLYSNVELDRLRHRVESATKSDVTAKDA